MPCPCANPPVTQQLHIRKSMLQKTRLGNAVLLKRMARPVRKAAALPGFLPSVMRVQRRKKLFGGV